MIDKKAKFAVRRQLNREIRTRIILLILEVVVLYIIIAYGAYAVRNPELTMTQVFLSFSDAILWR